MFTQMRSWYVLSFALLLTLVAGIAIFNLFSGEDESVSQAGETNSAGKSADFTGTSGGESEPIEVTLPPAKLAAAEIEVQQAKLGTLVHTHNVPGRVVYDQTRHVEVLAPTEGIITKVLVKPGDEVKARQVLAWFNSSEIGSARADVLQQISEAELTENLAQRAAELQENVNTLTYGLRKETDFDVLRDQLAGRILGDYREQLFGAYARFMQAKQMVTNAAPLAETGALPGKVVLSYQTELMDAQAALEAVCEQVDLEVWKESQQAKATAADAGRRLEIAKQHLSSLLLNQSAIGTADSMPDVNELGANENDLEHLSRVAIHAPFDGTIESLKYSASERIQANAPLLVLADTQSLWISAEIRENDWSALGIKTGQTLTVSIPALDGVSLPAKVEYVGREVSLHTNAISIMARIDNKKGKLRPGLFVRVAVPVSEKQNALIVPSRAVQQHAGHSFVFVPQSENCFRRVAVTTGDEGEGEIEILQGLSEKDQVVTEGAFLLKSELMLESEGE